MVEKHAYLIICHNNAPILKRLLSLLDDPRNDIYIHVDKKAVGFPLEECTAVVKRAALTYIPRRSVSWGSASMVWAELDLLREATKMPHAYYHLISGVDLPLKTQDEIHHFFAQHQGEEFFSWKTAQETNCMFRVSRYYPLQEVVGRGPAPRTVRLAVTLAAVLQIKILKTDRTKNSGLAFYKGAQWFSITHALAEYVLSQEKIIRQYFRMSFCADEMFLQTIALNSPFKAHIVNDDLREIDWTRGQPYTYTSEDFALLTSSRKLFARKFDCKTDMEIVEALYQHISPRQPDQ